MSKIAELMEAVRVLANAPDETPEMFHAMGRIRFIVPGAEAELRLVLNMAQHGKIAELIEMATSPCSTPIEALRQTARAAQAELQAVLKEIVRILPPARAEPNAGRVAAMIRGIKPWGVSASQSSFATNREWWVDGFKTGQKLSATVADIVASPPSPAGGTLAKAIAAIPVPEGFSSSARLGFLTGIEAAAALAASGAGATK